MQRQIGRVRADIEEWKARHDEVQRDLWVWEDLAHRWTTLFIDIVDILADIQQLLLEWETCTFVEALEDRLRERIEILERRQREQIEDMRRDALETLPQIERL